MCDIDVGTEDTRKYRRDKPSASSFSSISFVVYPHVYCVSLEETRVLTYV